MFYLDKSNRDKRRVLSRQARICRDKRKLVCRDKTFASSNILLSRQNFCLVKHTLVATKDVLCRDKHVFVATKHLSRQKLYLWQLPPVLGGRVVTGEGIWKREQAEKGRFLCHSPISTSMVCIR